MKNKRPHWYKTWNYECPVCGMITYYKERQYTPRPKKYSTRNKFFQTYDWCEGGDEFKIIRTAGKH